MQRHVKAIMLTTLGLSAGSAQAQDGYSDFQKQFLSQLQNQARTAVSAQPEAAGEPLTAVSGSEIGATFNWRYELIGATPGFNGRTYSWINAAATPVSNGVQLSGSFTQQLTPYVAALTWKNSKSLAAQLQDAQQHAANEESAMVSTWIQTFGPIPSTEPNAVIYILKQMATWSSKPMTDLIRDMRRSPNPRALFDKMPTGGDTMMGVLTRYITAMGTSMDAATQTALGQSVQSIAYDDLTNPTDDPSALNVFTIDPTNPSKTTAMKMPKYTIRKAPDQIQTDLDSTQSSVSVKLTISQESDKTVRANFSTGAGFSVPLDFLTIRASGTASTSVFSNKSAGRSAEIEINYGGVSLIPVTPEPFQFAGGQGQGWYVEEALQQALKNQGQDVTGYALLDGTDTSGLKKMARVSAVAVCKLPTVAITYNQADKSQFQSTFDQSASVGLTLFGILPLGGASESSHSATIDNSYTGQGVRVVFAPKMSDSTAIDRSFAYVIGAAIKYPFQTSGN